MQEKQKDLWSQEKRIEEREHGKEKKEAGRFSNLISVHEQKERMVTVET